MILKYGRLLMQDVCANFVVEQIVLQVVRARMPNLAEVLSGIMPLHMPNLQINEIQKKKRSFDKR